MCIYVYICTYVYMYICINACMYTCRYICICVYMYICVYVHLAGGRQETAALESALAKGVSKSDNDQLLLWKQHLRRASLR